MTNGGRIWHTVRSIMGRRHGMAPMFSTARLIKPPTCRSHRHKKCASGAASKLQHPMALGYGLPPCNYNNNSKSKQF